MSSGVQFEKLPVDTVLTGLEAVTVAVTPQALSDRCGVTWFDQDTELGPAVASIFRLKSGGPRFCLTSYEDSPEPCVTISSDAEATEADVDALLHVLGVDPGEIIDRVPVRDAYAPTRPATELE
jgi:hypothetical protein